MRRATALGLVVLVAGASVVGVGLADPFRDSPPAPRVNASDSPAEMAHDALLATERGDYTVRTALGNGTDWRLFLTTYVENTEREILIRGRPGGGDFVTYANAHVAWQGPPGELRRHPSDAETYYSIVRSSAPVTRSDAGVRVVDRNDSVIVLRVTDTDAAYALQYDEPNVTETERGQRYDFRANFTLVVSRDTGRLSRAVFRLSRADPDEPGRNVGVTAYRLRDWGDTTVERPASAGYSLAEFLLDVTGEQN